eukprot:3179256-Amphidinium_carterae.1
MSACPANAGGSRLQAFEGYPDSVFQEISKQWHCKRGIPVSALGGGEAPQLQMVPQEKLT